MQQSNFVCTGNTFKTNTEIKKKHAQDLASEQNITSKRLGIHDGDPEFDETRCRLVQSLSYDIRRRSSVHISDFVDGLDRLKAIHKTISTILFPCFACILPTIAFGAINDNNTHDQIDVRKSIIVQTMGSLVFAYFRSRPLVIVMTIASLSHYTKVILNICQGFKLNFNAMSHVWGYRTLYSILFFPSLTSVAL